MTADAGLPRATFNAASTFDVSLNAAIRRGHAES
jgi:hypothetical protein